MSRMDLLSRMEAYQGECLVYGKGFAMSYPEVVRAAEFNRDLLQKAGYGRGGGQALAVDVSLGWRCVPAILAALHLGIAVIPFDSATSGLPDAPFASCPAIGESNVAENGRIAASAFAVALPPDIPALSDVAFVMHTSGTTGRPRGVMLTYDNIRSNMAGIADYFDLTREDRLLIVRPLTVSSSLIGELLVGLAAGCRIHFKDPRQPPLSILPILSEHRITVAGMSPSLAMAISRFSGRYDFTTLRTLVLSGECLQPSQWLAISGALPGTSVWNVYGLTEASPRVCYCKTPRIRDGAVSVGFPLAGVSIRIVDDDGLERGDGQPGKVQVAGPGIMKGYYGDPESSSRRIRDGWLDTGDWGALCDGELYVSGRHDDMLIRGGNNIHPHAIENMLLRHPVVREALVFAVPDPRYGHKIHAWIVANEEIESSRLLRELSAAGVPPAMLPDRIEYRQTLPKTPGGKVIRPRRYANRP